MRLRLNCRTSWPDIFGNRPNNITIEFTSSPSRCNTEEHTYSTHITHNTTHQVHAGEAAAVRLNHNTSAVRNGAFIMAAETHSLGLGCHRTTGETLTLEFRTAMQRRRGGLVTTPNGTKTKLPNNTRFYAAHQLDIAGLSLDAINGL